MTKMDQFVNAMELAFSLAREVEGIDNINWDISYSGDTRTVQELKKRLDKALKDSGGTLSKEVA